jgi:hypothetical protein
MKRRFLLLPLLLLMASACEDLGPREGVAGVYRYTAYDDQGSLVITGELFFRRMDSTMVSGTWRFSASGSPEGLGPQIGEGNFLGNIQGGQMSLDLNPQYRDHNVILTGTITETRYEGEWMWVGYGGPIESGTFEAEKQRYSTTRGPI